MVNYQLGKIYKIVCNITGKVYVGSTCEPTLAKRLTKHVANYRSFCKSNGTYTSSYNILENEDYNILLIEDYPCETKDQLRARERYFKEVNVCINKNNPIRTKLDDKIHQKKYYDLNRETILIKGKLYRNKNCEKEKRRKKLCNDKTREKRIGLYQKNKKEILDKKKQYYLDN